MNHNGMAQLLKLVTEQAWLDDHNSHFMGVATTAPSRRFGFFDNPRIGDPSPIYNAVVKNDANAIDRLITQGYSARHVETIGADETTLVYTAATSDYIHALMCLIKHGADLHIKWHRDKLFEGDDNSRVFLGLQAALLVFVAGVDNFTKDAPGPCYKDLEKPKPLYPWHPRVTRPMLEQLCVDLRGADCHNLRSVPETARKPLQLFMIGIVYKRVMEVCVALHELDLPALLSCHIVEELLGSLWPLVPWHVYWNIVVAVKHFEPNWLGMYELPCHAVKVVGGKLFLHNLKRSGK